MSKGLNRRQFSILVAGAIAVPAVGVTSRRASAQDATPAATTGAEALAQMEGQVFSTGPNGESPTAASEVMLTDEELAEIQGMGRAIALSYPKV